MRDITLATRGTLARARRVVQFFVHKPHLAWSFPAGALEHLDVCAEGDWAAKETASLTTASSLPV